jgi:predicted RNase H-like HicB family nuclease
VEEMPGVNTQGRTLAEARRNLKEALTLVLEANRALCEKDRSPDTKREPITVTVSAFPVRRRDLLRHLANHGCVLLREGERHSIYYNPKTAATSSMPRHTEINDFLAPKIAGFWAFLCPRLCSSRQPGGWRFQGSE